MQLTERHRQYWQTNLRITAVLMAIWFVVTFVVGFFARDLNFTFFGWPFSFWVASQGALVVYCLIIWYYALHEQARHRAWRRRGGMTWLA
jgi:putative solute:sodium symporter small subunit